MLSSGKAWAASRKLSHYRGSSRRRGREAEGEGGGGGGGGEGEEGEAGTGRFSPPRARRVGAGGGGSRELEDAKEVQEVGAKPDPECCGLTGFRSPAEPERSASRRASGSPQFECGQLRLSLPGPCYPGTPCGVLVAGSILSRERKDPPSNDVQGCHQKGCLLPTQITELLLSGVHGLSVTVSETEKFITYAVAQLGDELSFFQNWQHFPWLTLHWEAFDDSQSPPGIHEALVGLNSRR
ncbi:uncharacterized protein [Notamacropus eugenii]|uniref:uncharacterized protein isoform X2 n=1 Tax=Notamacropus eugenii TaxID=9315 RepID=UPI003B680A8C